ncbi:RagB/SusD family nutrient uptake outer membrane protein [Flammeovirgaceae bacterium SG7u.111]|nr:RagB/SusD family nutrient uptake outer membrane protein [Flammeovirgaceae bacterium SG7u.132]WPO37603.1 RagB/SusD family nutrient uptake outer membrane protein [Flammeovirgaceae bacterium SG7u.111]
MKMLRATKQSISRRILLLMVAAFFAQSCVNELDQVNPNALTNDSFWQNTGDLNAGLNAAYAVLRDENILAITWDYTRTDIAVPFSYRWRNIGNPIYDQTFDLTTTQVQNKWRACFRGIFRANQVIDAYYNLENTFTSEAAEEAGIRILAQARTLRGYFYYVLHHSYNGGSVPLFESVPKDIEEFQKPMSPAADILNFYREDLQFGLENLPTTYNDWNSEVGAGNLGRVTGGFCEALLAKSYINENDFETAETLLLNVIENYNYALADDLEECFTGIAEFNSESIFEINFSSDVNPLGNDGQKLSQSVTDMLSDANIIQFSSWLTLKYRAERPDPMDERNYVDRNIYLDNGDLDSVQTDVLRMYSLRMHNSMSSVDDRDSKMYGVEMAEYGRSLTAPPHAKQYPNFIKKFTSWNLDNGGASEPETPEAVRRSGINIPVIRLAEIYLLYAECMLEKGSLSEGLRYINRIRKRSGLLLLGSESDAGAEYAGVATYVNDIDLDPSNGEQAVNVTNLMEHLRFTEKPLELSLEDDRTIDLRRWGQREGRDIWKEQLQHLASFEYQAWHFKNNTMGKNPNRWACFIMPAGELPSYESFNNSSIPPYAFRQPKATPEEHFVGPNLSLNNPHLVDNLLGSQNFVESIHSYLPIPQDEVNSNLNWDQ